MRNIICIGLLLLCFCADSPSSAKSILVDDEEYVLVFSDDFNSLDSTKWSVCQRNPSTWAKWISPSPKVAYVKRGTLVCKAIPNRSEPNDTASMLTGAIETRGKFSFKYGKVEVRMKTNMRPCNFPAAWLKPDDEVKGAPYGEIDIVEMMSNEGKATHTIHTHRSYTLKKEGITRYFEEPVDVTRWHVYGIIWTEDAVTWTIDGRVVGTYKKDHSPQMVSEGQWTFDRPFYIRLNQSVRKRAWNDPFIDMSHNYETRFDWIRVYQRKQDCDSNLIRK